MAVQTRPYQEGIGPRLFGERSQANKQPVLDCTMTAAVPFSPIWSHHRGTEERLRLLSPPWEGFCSHLLPLGLMSPHFMKPSRWRSSVDDDAH